MFRTALLSAAALAATMALPSAASAQSIAFRSTEVSYSDLNLASDKGAATFLSRVQRAAESICYGASPQRTDDIDAQKRAESCIADATAHAVASAHSSKVTALHARKTGAPAAEMETASAR